MGLNSDYGSMESSTSWGSQELNWQSFQSQLQPNLKVQKTSSLADLLAGKCTLQDVMQEFRMNGSDAPYNPEDDQLFRSPVDLPSTPMYSRQRSWPGAERAPRPQSLNIDVTPSFDKPDAVASGAAGVYAGAGAGVDALSDEQRRVLSSLTDSEVLRELQRRNKRQAVECRFCKNNGERESFYRGHRLKDARGRVACPVLRAFVCRRCGARGDTAHTIKYCPLTTDEERIKSSAMMRSVRKAAGRRRSLMAPSVSQQDNYEYVYFGDMPAAAALDDNTVSVRQSAPLHPLWAALEQKLML